MADRETLTNPKYINWVKGGLALKYLQTGLSEFAQNLAVTEHQEMINSTEIETGAACTTCDLKSIKPIHKPSKCPRGQKGCNCAHRNTKKCPKNICDTMYEEIMKHQGWNKIYMNNSDIRKWTTDPWEVAKCYINAPGYENTHSADETDATGLLHLFINNTKFKDHVDCEINFIKKIRNWRNSLFHSPLLELEDQTLADGIADIIAFLEDDKELRQDTCSKQSVLNLKELQRKSFIITPENVLDVLQEAEDVIAKRCEEYEEFKRKQELQDAQIIQLQETVKILKERLVSTETREHEQRTKMLTRLEETEKRLADDIRTVVSMKEIHDTMKAGESVCIIHCPTGSGTGFRVGVNKIMTAKYVVDMIISGSSRAGIKEATNQYACLAAEGVEAIFRYYDNDSYAQTLKFKFKFKPTVCFLDDELGVAILELDGSENESFPSAFRNFSRPEAAMPFKLIGHPNASSMSTDNVSILDLEQITESINLARYKSIKHAGREFDCSLFNAADNPKRVLFHCTFSHGAGGSPGVIVNSGGCVVTMLLCGYPEWFYDTNIEQSKKDSWPKELKVEQGVNMESVFKEMEKRCPDLSREIFPALKYF